MKNLRHKPNASNPKPNLALLARCHLARNALRVLVPLQEAEEVPGDGALVLWQHAALERDVLVLYRPGRANGLGALETDQG